MSRAGWSGGHVERFEAVPVQLDFPGLHYVESQAGEDLEDQAHGLADRVQAAAAGTDAGQSHVGPIALGGGCGGQALFGLGQGGAYLLLGLVGGLAECGALFGGQLAGLAQQGGDDAFAAQVLGAQLGHAPWVTGSGQLGQGGVEVALQLG